MFPSLIVSVLSGSAWLRHAPHDPAYAMAACVLPSGVEDVVVLSDERATVHSRDGLISFQLLPGDGLQSVQGTCVAYHPNIPWAGGAGQGCFLIGTEAGLWKYEPSDAVSGPVEKLSDGLPADANVFAVACPDGTVAGIQPAFLVTRRGEIYRLRADASGWDLVLDTGASVQVGAILMRPNFDASVPGPRAAVIVAMNNRVYRSVAGGASGSWSNVQNFTGGWKVTCMAMDADYGTNPKARIYAGLGRPVTGGDEGQIQTSLDGGLNYQVRYNAPSAVFAITALPAGPNQPPAVFASARVFPGADGTSNNGVLRSYDRGQTWSDANTWQCFLLEHDPQPPSGYPGLRFNQQILALPDYTATGRMLYGRNEGLYLSEDEGTQFLELPLRSSRDVRDVGTAKDALGHVHVYAASYGEALTAMDLDTGVENHAEPGTGVIYQLPLAVSPDFLHDGAAYAGGHSKLSAWFDPVITPPANGFGVSGALGLSTRDTQTGDPLLESIRAMALSPHFSAVPGSPDQVMYFSSWANLVYVSTDAGATYKLANTTSNGRPMPYLRGLGIAPSFNAALPHSDVYAIGDGGALFRMTNDVWQVRGNVGHRCNDLLVDPTYDPVSNRRVWVALDDTAGVMELNDDFTNPSARVLFSGMPPAAVWSLAAGQEGSTLWLYAATWASGVWKRQVNNPNSSWQPLSTTNYPRAWTKGIALAPDWPVDARVFIGTSDGVWWLDELSATPTWQPLNLRTVYDNREASLITYEPSSSEAVDPNLPWPWPTTRSSVAPIPVFGEDVWHAPSDGSYLLARGWARSVIVHSASGPACGVLVLSATDRETGALLASTSVDLLGTSFAPTPVTLDLQQTSARPIELRVEADLDLGETLWVDALEFLP